LAVEITDYMAWKLVALAVVAFFYGLWKALSGK
jgi:hypothetical protein